MDINTVRTFKEIPLLSSLPEIEEADRTIARIQLELKDKERRRSDLIESQNARGLDLDEQAKTYLESGEFVSVRSGNTQAEIEALTGQVRILRRALEQARHDRERKRQEASRRLCAQLEPPYRALVLRLVEAVTAAVNLARDERAVVDGLRTAGYAHMLPVGAFPVLGFNLNDVSTFAGRWLADCRRAGLIK